MKIILVGSMAAGKTYIGKVLAQKLNCAFVDSDAWIESQAGISIADMFSIEGEEAFRDWETRALKELLKQENVVLATGGGVIKRKENRTLMAKKGTVIYLDVAIPNQLARTAGDKTRPLLNVPDREAKLKELREERDPLYREVANVVVDANQTPFIIVEEILKSVLTG